MPTIYQGNCRNCGYQTPFLTSSYGAVFVDDPVPGVQHEVAGAVLPKGDEEKLATTNDPNLVVLAHPCEQSILTRTGHTWGSLLRQGRYVAVRNAACRGCGTVFAQRRLTAPPLLGCALSLVVGALGGILAGLLRQSLLEGFVLWLCLTAGGSFAMDWMAGFYFRRRFSSRAASLANGSACPNCRTRDSTAIESRQVVICPVCHQAKLRFDCVGRS